jgi:signal transduction histidine kinase
MIDRFFGTTLGQILAIIASSTAITFFLFLALLSAFHPGPPPQLHWPWPHTYRIVGLLEDIRDIPQGQRAAFIAHLKPSNLTVRLTKAPMACKTLSSDASEIQEVLTSELRDPALDLRVRSCNTSEPDQSASIQVLTQLGDQTLEIRIVIGPLRRLSEKADAFGRDIAVAPIEEEGPLEIRRATRAFNFMQERIASSIRDRTRMLAAVSHDLRTPLTRMRLLLETNAQNEMQSKLLQNVKLMQSIVASAVAFLSGSFDKEEMEWLDLGALLLTLCDEFEEAGCAVRYIGPEQLRCFCRPNAIARAITNLIENACSFGTEVTINASMLGDEVIVDVEDDGPGIPQDRKRQVMEPFVRLDPSRAGRPGSVGLGLSIVQEIVTAHSGTITLFDREPNGLIARVTLPVSARSY